MQQAEEHILPVIRHLSHAAIDKKKWDDCIRRSVNGIIYAYSWYLDRVSPGWEALVKGDYESIFPLTAGKKLGIRYLYQPYFTQQLGLFSAGHGVSGELLVSFLRAIPATFRYIDISLNTFNDLRGLSDFHLHKRITYHLDLIRSYEDLHSVYSENLKRNIRKAMGEGIRIVKNVPPRDVVKIFRAHKGKELLHIPSKIYGILDGVIAEGIAHNAIDCWGALDAEGVLRAGVIFTQSDGKAIYLLSASDAFAKECGAMHLLIDAYIREQSGKNLVLDFEGSSIPGLARFYKSFGARECTYLHIRRNALPLPVRWLKSVNRTR